MRFTNSVRSLVVITLVCILSSEGMYAQEGQSRRRGQAVAGKDPPHPPKVGEQAPDFALKTLDGKAVKLKTLTSEKPVVLLVLRGWPEYQCPICSRQVGEFLSKKSELSGVHLVMVYPGPADKLGEHAKEFQGDLSFPVNFHYVTDPDYTFTNAWGLRWEASRETAYPSTFIIGKDNSIKFGVTSTSHGGRSSAAIVLEELAKLSAAKD